VQSAREGYHRWSDGTCHLYSSSVPATLLHQEQAASYKTEREAIVIETDAFDASIALNQVDFSEKYTWVVQNEIQSAHWRQNQVSLFAAVLWYYGSIHSRVIASDDLVHTKETVIAYVDKLWVFARKC